MCDNNVPSRERVSGQFIEQNNVSMGRRRKDFVGEFVNYTPVIDNSNMRFGQWVAHNNQ